MTKVTCEQCDTACARGCYSKTKCKLAPVQTKIKRKVQDVHDNLNKYDIKLSRPVKKLKFGLLLVNNDKKSRAKAEAGEVDRLSV